MLASRSEALFTQNTYNQFGTNFLRERKKTHLLQSQQVLSKLIYFLLLICNLSSWTARKVGGMEFRAMQSKNNAQIRKKRDKDSFVLFPLGLWGRHFLIGRILVSYPRLCKIGFAFSSFLLTARAALCHYPHFSLLSLKRWLLSYKPDFCLALKCQEQKPDNS